MNKLGVDDIVVKSIEAHYDPRTTTKIEETESMLFYKTQTFYCKVQLEIPECQAARDWTVGLVQACDYMHLENGYGRKGCSLWEFHPLKSGLRGLMNDSDGKRYPFYSINQSVHHIPRGYHRKTTVNLQIKDYFHPSVVWELPYAGGVKLTEIQREQWFIIYLIAIRNGRRPGSGDHSGGALGCGNGDEITVLRSLRWQYNMHMRIDPHLPLGERVIRKNDRQYEEPLFSNGGEVDEHTTFPKEATMAPHCNAAQSLIWYPLDMQRHPRILVPPKQIIVPWGTWVRDMLGCRFGSLRKPEEVNELCSRGCCVCVEGCSR